MINDTDNIIYWLKHPAVAMSWKFMTFLWSL